MFADLGAVASAATPARGLRRSRFTPYVGQTVSLRTGRAAPVAGRLIAVEDVPAEALAGSEHAYVLRIRARRTTALGRQITTVKHSRCGSVELFMSEGARKSDGQDYLAVVNRVTR